MGNKLFGIDISGLIKKYVAPGVLAATLYKVTPGTRTGGALTSGTNPNAPTYSCRGFIDKQKNATMPGSLTPDRFVYITLIGDTITAGIVPEPNDRILIEGRTYQIAGPVDRDPAAATYSCPCTAR